MNESAIEVLQQIHDVLEEIRERVAMVESSRSSVELKTSTRGVDITCKAYSGSPIDDAEAEAIESYFRLKAEVEERLMADFKATVAGAKT